MTNVIVKTTAIVLRIFPFSRTSHVVAWLSPEFGKITTIIKGARRPKSSFLGQYDIGTICELLFYQREREGLHFARECTPLDWRPHLRVHWRPALTASYLCNLAGQVSVPMAEAATTFGLLDHSLDSLAATSPSDSTIITFELALLSHLGLAPDFSLCPLCRSENHHGSPRFSLSSGRLRCPHTSHELGETTVALNPELLTTLRDWQLAASTNQSPPSASHSPSLRLAIRRFLGMFIQYHLDLSPVSRQDTFAWLDSRV